MLVTGILKQLKIGVGTLTLMSHKFCVLFYSKHSEMNIDKK